MLLRRDYRHNVRCWRQREKAQSAEGCKDVEASPAFGGCLAAATSSTPAFREREDQDLSSTRDGRRRGRRQQGEPRVVGTGEFGPCIGKSLGVAAADYDSEKVKLPFNRLNPNASQPKSRAREDDAVAAIRSQRLRQLKVRLGLAKSDKEGKGFLFQNLPIGFGLG